MCLEAGVNLIDTANMYSTGASEEIIGQAIKGRRDDLFLATKVRFPMGDGPTEAGLSRTHHVEPCDARLRRAQTDHSDPQQAPGRERPAHHARTLARMCIPPRRRKLRREMRVVPPRSPD